MLRIKNILIFPLYFLLFAQLVHGSAVRTVVYHDGVLENEDTSSSSSSIEAIPPREEWFRVRGDSVVQSRPKAVSHGAREIVVLPPARSLHSDLAITDIADSASKSEENNDGQVKVYVRNRGRIGFQHNRATMSGRRHDEYMDREYRPFGSEGRRTNGDVSEMSKLPSTISTTRQENWYPHGQRHGEADQEARQEDRATPEEPSFHTSQSQTNKEDVQYFNEDDLVVIDGGDTETETRNNRGNTPRIISSTNVRDSESDTPPPHDQVAKMARYIVRHSNWTSVATISTLSSLTGFPFANVFSVSDGPPNNSSGVPYLFLTPLDMSATDLQKDSRASMTMSLAQSDYCRQQNYDPEDPRCAHVILSGTIVQIATTSDEIGFARRALFSKHPEMEEWPKDHGWYFAKLNITHIIVLDYFGGAKTVSPKDYFKQTIL